MSGVLLKDHEMVAKNLDVVCWRLSRRPRLIAPRPGVLLVIFPSIMDYWSSDRRFGSLLVDVSPFFSPALPKHNEYLEFGSTPRLIANRWPIKRTILCPDVPNDSMPRLIASRCLVFPSETILLLLIRRALDQMLVDVPSFSQIWFCASSVDGSPPSNGPASIEPTGFRCDEPRSPRTIPIYVGRLTPRLFASRSPFEKTIHAQTLRKKKYRHRLTASRCPVVPFGLQTFREHSVHHGYQ